MTAEVAAGELYVSYRFCVARGAYVRGCFHNRARWVFLAGVVIVSGAASFAQVTPATPDYSDACRHAPQGSACAVQRERVEAAHIEMRAALADQTNCARLVAARDRFQKGLNEWVKLETARISCELVAGKAELSKSDRVDRGGGRTSVSGKPEDLKDVANDAAKDPFAIARPQPSAGEPRDVFRIDTKKAAPAASNPRDVFKIDPGLTQPKARSSKDLFDAYKSYDRDGSSVPVNVHRPGEPWTVERDGVPIGVTHLDELFDTSDADKKLQMAGLELKQQQFVREANEREAVRQAEEARREQEYRAVIAAQRAEQEEQAERERRRAEREQKSAETDALLGLVLGGLQAYNTSKGYTTPATGGGFSGSTSSYSGFGSSGSSTGGVSSSDPRAAMCAQQVRSAANLLARASAPSGGVCAASRQAVQLYSQVERAYAGCEQYYGADYQAAVTARRQAEQTAQSACVSPDPIDCYNPYGPSPKNCTFDSRTGTSRSPEPEQRTDSPRVPERGREILAK